MRKYFACVPLLAALLCLSGCTAGDKSVGLSVVYGVVAAQSLLVLVGYVCSAGEREGLFVLLFSAVLLVNAGYMVLSLSTTLEQALWANRLAYLGSVFLLPVMLLITLNAVKACYPKWLSPLMAVLGAVVFLVAASPGVLTVYYREVSLVTVNGCAALKKVYGPLHGLYAVYLMAYFAAMVVLVLWAAVKKRTGSPGHVVILAIAVFVNLGVWFIEQMVDLDFEFLSVSYIISELFLLGLHMVVQENRRLRERVREAEEAGAPPLAEPEPGAPDLSFMAPLTPTERMVCTAYLDGMTTKEIMAMLHIKENTLKFHNKNLYQKLGVSSRKELQAVYGPRAAGK